MINIFKKKMINLFLIKDYISNGFISEFIDILYILSLIFGVLIIISKNPIISVLYLIGLFIDISLILILIGLNYIGLSYILVYVGAVSILFLFILMLINIRISELLNETNNYIPLAIFTVILFFNIIGQVLPVNFVNKKIYGDLSGFEFQKNINDISTEKIVYASSKS
jgi:NADH-ubiquinone oxidoreductase chain 6